MFRFMERNRMAAIEAPQGNIRTFNRLFQQALEALYPQHVVLNFIQQMENVDPELLNFQFFSKKFSSNFYCFDG